MAGDSYKVSLGAELRTKELDKQVKDYKGNVNVGVNPENIKSDIDTALKNYKAAPIEVGSTLNIEGITKTIESLNAKANRKNIKVGIDQSHLFDGLETVIGNKTFDTPLKIKTQLNWTGVKGQIANPTEDIGMLQLNAVLNKNAIKNAINDFNKEINDIESKVRVKVKVDPDLKALNNTLKNYQLKPVKITPDLKKSEIDKQIGDYNNRKNKRNIQLKAKLADGTIEEAVSKYASKEVVPVKVDFIVGTTKPIDDKISEYKNKGVDVPVRLMPAAKDFTTKIKNTPIQVSATVDKEGLKTDVEAAVGGYTPTAKMPVNIKLTQPKDINAQVKSLTKPTETIDVGVKLDTSDVNTQISLFQPSATLGVKPDLIFDNAEEEIRNYIPKEKIKVNLEIVNDSINAEAGKTGEQKPVNINVKLDRENINKQIREFKTNTKIKVGVKLDFASHKDGQKGVPQQIKDYKTDSKIKVGIQLDEESIRQEINNIKTDTPVKLGVELDPEGVKNVKNQVDDLRQRLEDIGNAIVNISGNVASNSVGAASAQQVSQQTKNIISNSAKRAIKNISSPEIQEAFEVSDIDSEAFEDEMNKLVRKWTNNKGNVVDIQIETKTRFDEDEQQNIEELSKAHVTYKNAANESIKKTLEWKQIGVEDDGKTAIMGWVEGHATYRSAIEKTKVQTDKFVKQQKKAVGDLTNQINQINRSAIDQNASRPIKEQSHLNQLESKYQEITNAITAMGNASRDTFDDEQNRVKRLISEYKSMKSEFQNAENVANKLTGTDYQSGRNIAEQNLAEFKTKAKDYAAMSKTLKDLDVSFSRVGDASSLKEFNNELRVAKAELAKVKAEANAADLGRKLSGKVSSLTSSIDDFRKANGEVVNFKAKIDNADVSIESLLNDLSQVKTKADFDAVSDKFNRFKEAAKNAGVVLNDTVVKVSTIKDIKNKLEDVGFDGFSQEVVRAHADVENLKLSSKDLQDALIKVDNALEAVKTADDANDMKALVAANEEYEQSLKNLYSIINLCKQAQKDAFDEDNLKLDKEKSLLRLENLFEDGSQAAKRYAEEVNRLREEINNCANDGDMKKINKEISLLEENVKKDKLQTQTLGSRLKEQLSRYSNYLSVASVFMYATQAMRSMFEQVKLIDSAMTELKKVTNETDASYNNFLKNAASRAKELGTTIDGLVASTADFARLGYGFKESQQLAEVANIYAVVGDEIEGVEDATQSLVSTMAAFKGEMNGMSDGDFAMGIVDKMNEVSNNFAISSGGIGQALQRSASSMAAANNTLDETISLITAAM